jgi:hypothetical protein
MAQYKVVGLPNRSADGNLNKTVQPIDKKKATIEAEKGEKIWTNYNRNVDNLVELKSIGGKTHANGGTPMDPPSSGKEGESSSFIFSNNRKMIIKDPELLKYFGENGKSEKTPAEVSSKWLDALATAKAILKDEHQDKIAKDSAKLTMDNAAFNLSSLALWQESKKNFKDGMTDIFNPWFDKTKVTPQELFSVDAEHEQKATSALKAAFGGPMYRADGGSSNCPEGMIWSDADKTCVSLNNKPINSNVSLGADNKLSLNYSGNINQTGVQTNSFGVGYQNDNANANADYNVANKSIMINGNKQLNIGNGKLGVYGGYSAPVNEMNKGSFNGGINYNTKLGDIPVKLNFGISQRAFGGPSEQESFSRDPQYLEYEEEKSLDPQLLSSNGLKRFDLGGGNNDVVPPYKGTEADLKKYFNNDKDAAAQYQYIESLKTNPAFKKALYKEYKKAWDKQIHGRDYGKAIKDKKWGALGTEDDVVNNFVDMQKRNLALKAYGIDYNLIGQNASDKNTSKYTNEFLKSKGLEKDLEIPGSDKTAQEQAAYIAFHELTRKQGTYNDNKELEGVLAPFEAPKLGIADENVLGKRGALSLADGVYTDTTTGQIAGFHPPKVIEAKDAKEDIYKKGTVEHLPEPSPYIQPDAYRIQDERTMNRAYKAKRNIINIPEWQKASQFNLLEPQFDSPERKIAEANTLAAGAIASASSFGSQAATKSVIDSINAQVYARAAGAIDDTSTKNLGLWNSTNQANTQLANAKHEKDSNEATGLWASHAKRVQDFANSHAKADDVITAAQNNADTERANRWNINTNSTYEKIDPRTGKIYQANAKPLDGKETADADLASEFQSYKERLPGVDDKVILGLMKGKRTGDFAIKDDGVLTPNELKG